jgi:hypothetical protein
MGAAEVIRVFVAFLLFCAVMVNAMSAAFGTTPANDLANYICRGTAPTALTTPVKMSLHTADPGATGASEATGGSYARQTAGYNTASGGACALAATLNFTGLAAATYTHIGLWDSTATPKFLQGAALSASQTLPGGATLQITAATDTFTGT